MANLVIYCFAEGQGL